jgi:hypothetical protein
VRQLLGLAFDERASFCFHPASKCTRRRQRRLDQFYTTNDCSRPQKEDRKKEEKLLMNMATVTLILLFFRESYRHGHCWGAFSWVSLPFTPVFILLFLLYSLTPVCMYGHACEDTPLG